MFTSQSSAKLFTWKKGTVLKFITSYIKNCHTEEEEQSHAHTTRMHVFPNYYWLLYNLFSILFSNKETNLHGLVKLHLVEHSAKQTHKSQFENSSNNTNFSLTTSIHQSFHLRIHPFSAAYLRHWVICVSIHCKSYDLEPRLHFRSILDCCWTGDGCSCLHLLLLKLL